MQEAKNSGVEVKQRSQSGVDLVLAIPVRLTDGSRFDLKNGKRFALVVVVDVM